MTFNYKFKTNQARTVLNINQSGKDSFKYQSIRQDCFKYEMNRKDNIK